MVNLYLHLNTQWSPLEGSEFLFPAVLGIIITCSISLGLELWFSNWGIVMPQPEKHCLCPLKGQKGKGSDVTSRISLLPGIQRFCYIFNIPAASTGVLSL